MDGHGIPEILDAILKFFPLDPYVENPTILMAVLPGDPYKPEIWDTYREIGKKYEAEGLREIAVQKPEFYPPLLGRFIRECFAQFSPNQMAQRGWMFEKAH